MSEVGSHFKNSALRTDINEISNFDVGSQFKNSELRNDINEISNFDVEKKCDSIFELKEHVIMKKQRRKKKTCPSLKQYEDKVTVKTENVFGDERDDFILPSQLIEALKEGANSEEKLNSVYSEHSIKEETENYSFKDSQFMMHEKLGLQQFNSNVYEPCSTGTQQFYSNVYEPCGTQYSASPNLVLDDQDLCQNLRLTERKYVKKYQATLKRRSTEKICTCNICGAVFTRKNSLNRHQRIHTGERPHKCNICSALFNRKNSLNRHRRIHTGIKPYKCSICWASFTLKQGLAVHQRTHLRNISFKDKKYTAAPQRFNVILNDKTYIVANVKQSSEERMKPTEEYRKDFEEIEKCSEVNKNIGENNLHFEEEEKAYPTESKIATRRIKKHSEESKMAIRRTKKHVEESIFKCYICDAVFTRRNSLNRHQTVHTGEKPFNCNICSAVFARKNSLKRHQRIHTREKPFRCNICNAYFAQKMHLVVHERIHTGEKPYKCNICSASFTVKKGLLVHTKIHHYDVNLDDKAHNVTQGKNNAESNKKLPRESQNIFSCHICSAVFTRKNSLNRHRIIHTGDKPYQCDTCSAVFTRKNSLNRHQRIHKRENN